MVLRLQGTQYALGQRHKVSHSNRILHCNKSSTCLMRSASGKSRSCHTHRERDILDKSISTLQWGTYMQTCIPERRKHGESHWDSCASPTKKVALYCESQISKFGSQMEAFVLWIHLWCLVSRVTCSVYFKCIEYGVVKHSALSLNSTTTLCFKLALSLLEWETLHYLTTKACVLYIWHGKGVI